MLTRTRVHLAVVPAHLSRGLHRVADALTRHAPDWAEIVADPAKADLLVYHVIGFGSLPPLPDLLRQNYALVQYCLRSTEDPTPAAWLPVWRGAKAVWSYYNLDEFAGEAAGSFPFYYASLGVDTEVFRPGPLVRTSFIIGTSGYIAETEGVRECHAAARLVNRKQFHLGPDLELGPGVSYMLDVPDSLVADAWGRCAFVAGLRRCEGFELPALEGLACGARPVVFDAPHYRRWYGGHAEYVAEGPADRLVADLADLFSRPVRTVTAAERAAVAVEYDWGRIAARFWERLEAGR